MDNHFTAVELTSVHFLLAGMEVRCKRLSSDLRDLGNKKR